MSTTFNHHSNNNNNNDSDSSRIDPHSRSATVDERSPAPSRVARFPTDTSPGLSRLEDGERQIDDQRNTPARFVDATDRNDGGLSRGKQSDILEQNVSAADSEARSVLSRMTAPESMTASGGNVANESPRRVSVSGNANASHRDAAGVASMPNAVLDSSCDFDSSLLKHRDSAVPTAVDAGPGSPDLRLNGSPVTPRPLSPRQGASEDNVELAPGQKRTATGDIKLSPSSQLGHDAKNAAGRLRSRTLDSASQHGNKIAELSVQLRARLSYAAAQVEKSWQSREHDKLPLPLRIMQSTSPTSSRMEGARSPYQFGHSNGSFEEGTTVSEPGSPASPHFRRPHNNSNNNSMRRSPWHVSQSPYASSQSTQSTLRTSRSSPTQLRQMSILAPPSDIAFSGQNHQRRRRNPNEPQQATEYAPSALQNRYYPQGSAPPVTSSLGPPSIPASGSRTSHNNNFPERGMHSQNATMEQDAIETLLFMSSPENSQHRQNTIPNSIDSSMGTSASNATGYLTQQSSQTESSQGGQAAVFTESKKSYGGGNLEARAGDEIDRILDQMDDSEVE